MQAKEVDRRYLDWSRAYNEDVLKTKHFNSDTAGTRVVPKVDPDATYQGLGGLRG